MWIGLREADYLCRVVRQSLSSRIPTELDADSSGMKEALGFAEVNRDMCYVGAQVGHRIAHFCGALSTTNSVQRFGEPCGMRSNLEHLRIGEGANLDGRLCHWTNADKAPASGQSFFQHSSLRLAYLILAESNLSQDSNDH